MPIPKNLPNLDEMMDEESLPEIAFEKTNKSKLNEPKELSLPEIDDLEESQEFEINENEELENEEFEEEIDENSNEEIQDITSEFDEFEEDSNDENIIIDEFETEQIEEEIDESSQLADEFDQLDSSPLITNGKEEQVTNKNKKNFLDLFKKKEKENKVKKINSTSDKQDFKKYYKIGGAIILALILLFVGITIFNKLKKKEVSPTKAPTLSEKTTDNKLKISNGIVSEDGKYKIDITSDKDTKLQFVETAILTNPGISKCTTFDIELKANSKISQELNCDLVPNGKITNKIITYKYTDGKNILVYQGD